MITEFQGDLWITVNNNFWQQVVSFIVVKCFLTTVNLLKTVKDCEEGKWGEMHQSGHVVVLTAHVQLYAASIVGDKKAFYLNARPKYISFLNTI